MHKILWHHYNSAPDTLHRIYFQQQQRHGICVNFYNQICLATLLAPRLCNMQRHEFLKHVPCTLDKNPCNSSHLAVRYQHNNEYDHRNLPSELLATCRFHEGLGHPSASLHAHIMAQDTQQWGWLHSTSFRRNIPLSPRDIDLLRMRKPYRLTRWQYQNMLLLHSYLERGWHPTSLILHRNISLHSFYFHQWHKGTRLSPQTLQTHDCWEALELHLPSTDHSHNTQFSTGLQLDKGILWCV